MGNFEKWVETYTYDLVKHMQSLTVVQLSTLVKQLQLEQRNMQLTRKQISPYKDLTNYVTTFVIERRLKDLEEIAQGIITEKSPTLT